MRHWLATHVLIGCALLPSRPIGQEAGAPKNLPHLPYVAVHNPQFMSASEATFLNDDDRVIGVETGGTAKAFPAGILAQHGLVEDQSRGGPIAVTW